MEELPTKKKHKSTCTHINNNDIDNETCLDFILTG